MMSGNLKDLFGIDYDQALASTWAYFYIGTDYSGGSAREVKILHLDSIRVRRQAPPGYGSNILEALCRVADKNGFLITLSLATKGDLGGDGWKRTTSSRRLDRWYRRYGFKRSASQGRYDLRGTYFRMPKVAESVIYDIRSMIRQKWN